jgi:hypothetical protein
MIGKTATLVLPYTSLWRVAILCKNHRRAYLEITASTMLEAAIEAHYECRTLLHSVRAINSIVRVRPKR